MLLHTVQYGLANCMEWDELTTRAGFRILTRVGRRRQSRDGDIRKGVQVCVGQTSHQGYSPPFQAVVHNK